jgi:serine phosphatase RsbU (regulator of sigma subunit)
MTSLALKLSRKLWPEIDHLPTEVRTSGMANIISVLYSAPLFLVGLVWLALETSPEVLQDQFAFLVLTGIFMYALEKLSFFLTIETGNGRYISTEGGLDIVLLWAAIFLVGPSAIWLGVFFVLLVFFRLWHSYTTTGERWNSLRNLTMGGAGNTLAVLVTLEFYERIGGEIPLPGLNPNVVLPALAALGFYFLLTFLLWSGFVLFVLIHRGSLFASNSSAWIIRVVLMALALPNLATPVGVLAAGLYAQNTIFMYLFYVTGIFLIAILARKLSMEAEFNRQRARQLEKLELLGEAIINSPPDASYLPQLLEANVPDMFAGRVIIWINDNQVLLRHPADWDLDPQPVAAWLRNQESASAFVINDPLPWMENSVARRPSVVCPIHDNEAGENIGGIYLEGRRVLPPWGKKELHSLFPPLYSLASQITSALHQAERYAQLLDYQRLSQELSLAGRIQASFLPNRMPDLPGWQLAVTLQPARATSGDFFDFIPLTENKLGIVIADVVDKGIGPALYMALSRTLLRTFATQYTDLPDRVLSLTNQRILSDARAHLFVTLFYGILDWETGEIKYCNAGHNPPILLRHNSPLTNTSLVKTGIPIGIDEDAFWEVETLSIQPGDQLILYTDGVVEAQNQEGMYFDEELLLEAVQARQGNSAHEIQSAILDALYRFIGDYPQMDDITLMVLARDPHSTPGVDPNNKISL